MNTWIKNGLGTAVVAAAFLGTGWAVQRYHKPGQLDVLTAQAMDMSQMRPPTGAAPVALASVKQGALADTVTYTGSILAFNEQDISPRITGTLVSLPVYPGQTVRTDEVVAQLDTSAVGPQAASALAQARQARIGAQVAHLTHHLHHRAALEQASAQADAARQGVLDAQADVRADGAAITEAQAGVQSAQAGADYWKTEIVREKQLAGAGAVSQQEYQSELSQAQAASAALAQAQAKVGQAADAAGGARAKEGMARRQADAAAAGVQMAQADIAVAEGQAVQAEAGADAASAAARSAAIQQGYARITAPFGGVVTARPAAPGSLVQPGAVLLKIAEIDRVRVQANVATEDLASIHVGSPVSITVPGDGGRSIAAHVSSVFPSASSQTRTAVVEAIVPNPHHRLLPGAFVTMQITKSAVQNTLLVPAEAIVSQGGRSYVWITDGGAAGMDAGRLVPVPAASSGLTAHQIVVEPGASDGTLTAVSSDALSAGMQVVTRGQAGLTDGVQVVQAAWGADGPQFLPTAAAASAGAGQTVYRCEKCGMTYSAADAKKNNYHDPMDGGKLVPVTPAPPASAPAGGMGGMKM